MIAKRVMRGKASGEFKRLSAYILNPEKLAAESGWRQTAEYVVDLAGGGARTTAVRITNCQSEEIDWAIIEIEAVQAQNRRAKGDRTYHLVVSFPPGEKPAPAQLVDIEDELCRAIGLHAHQRISAVHTDTAHLHMHVAINQIHPQTLTCVEPWYDKRKLMEACTRLEIKHGLQVTNHGEAVQEKVVGAKKTPQRTRAVEAHGGGQSLLEWLRVDVRPRLIEPLRKAANWEDVHAALAAHGLEIKQRGAGLVIVANRGTARVKASSVDAALAHSVLAKRFGAYLPPSQGLTVSQNQGYQGQKMRTGKEAKRLWKAYQNQRQAVLAARRTAMDEIGARQAARREGTLRWYFDTRDEIVGTYALTGAGKKDSLGRLDLEQVRELAKWKAQAQDERQAARRAHPVKSWVNFLREAASAGDTEALAVLRRNEEAFQQAVDARVRSQTAGEQGGEQRIIQELRPDVRSNGDAIYRLRDGGVLIDRGGRTEIEKLSPFSVLLHLKMAMATNPGKPVDPDGDQIHVGAAIYAAVAAGLPIQFKQAAHEEERRKLVVAVGQCSAAHAALAYVLERESERGEREGDGEYRFWVGEDIRGATPAGVVLLRDGSHGALWRRDGTTYVKALLPGEAEPAKVAAAAIDAAVPPQVRKRGWLRW